MIRQKTDFFVLESTGREAYANCGFVGINDDLELSYGYDGIFVPYLTKIDIVQNKDSLFAKAPWTPQERTEIANYMIDLWTKFKEEK